MTPQKRARRSDTRKCIQDVALELFAEHGYEKTSLREIADRLDVTKAALYYHFKTKEEILVSIVEEMGRPVEELIEWAQGRPRTPETREELLRRYADAMRDAAPLYRFLQENQATVRDLDVGARIKQRFLVLANLLTDEDADLTHRLRCSLALFTLHGAFFLLQHTDTTTEEKHQAAWEVAVELISQAARTPS